MIEHPESRPNLTARDARDLRLGRHTAGTARRAPRARAIPRPRPVGAKGGLLVQGAGLLTIAIVAFLALFLAGCGGGSEAAEAPGSEATPNAASAEATALADGAASRTPIPLDHADPIQMRVYASPTCGCCSLWVEHLEENGFDVETVHRDDMADVKRNFGVGDRLLSCHTGIVNGYVVEGHVPAADIRRLLAESPGDVRGLAVPGMPVGSPGMEVGDRVDPYDVLAFSADGSTRVFASYGR
ncbi:hypothetical protein BH23GEM11_BH23GEM11_15150 [soil metagenome]